MMDDDDDDASQCEHAGCFHTWFRGASNRLGEMVIADVAELIEELVWTYGVGESDQDPLYVFEGYHLMCSYKMVHASVGLCAKTMAAHEYRVFNVFDHEHKLIDTVTYGRVRDADLDEIPDETDGEL